MSAQKEEFCLKAKSLAFLLITIFFSTSAQDMKTRCTSGYWNAREHKVANKINVLCANELLLPLTPWQAFFYTHMKCNNLILRSESVWKFIELTWAGGRVKVNYKAFIFHWLQC